MDKKDVNVNFSPNASPVNPITSGVVDIKIAESQAKVEGELSKVTEKIVNVTAQLAETETQIIETNTKLNGKNFKERKAYFTIMDDDGKANFMTKIKPVLDAHGIKASVAINPGYIGVSDFMTWANIKQLHSEGYEILNHGWKGESPENLTLEKMQENYVLEKDMFLTHGIDTYDYYVYSGVQPWSNAELKAKLQKVYKCSYANSDAKDSNIPFDNFAVKRIGVTLDTVNKAYIDQCIDNNGYLVIFGHSWDTNYTIEKLNETLAYLKSKNITYVSAKDAIDGFGNSLELGNNGGEYFYVDKNGNVDFTYQGRSVIELYKAKNEFKVSQFSNAPLTEYKSNVITVEPISSQTALNLGLPDAGLIQTIRYRVDAVSTLDVFSSQTYTHYVTGRTYARHWKQRLGVWCWYPFVPTSSVNVTTSLRPRYAPLGTHVFDTTLSKPIWCKTEGYQKKQRLY